jgi:hypothetical protein
MRNITHSRKPGIVAAFAVMACTSVFGQQLDLPEGPAGNAKYGRPLAMGPRQPLIADSAAGGTGLAFYSALYQSLGTKKLPFNIIGTDPSLGAATTTVPIVIVPIRLTFSSGFTLDGTNVVAATANSPLFLTADYTTPALGTDVGVTQYGDAIQRAEFWNLPGFSTDYHVLLSTPTIAATVSITVPAGMGNTYGGGTIGVVDNAFFDSILNGLFSSYPAGTMPIFLTDNVFEGAGGLSSNCCILGYHASEGPPIATAHTWIYAAYTEPGTFTGNVIQDVQALSHEVAEWLNDPFVGTPLLGGVNLVPPAVLPGEGGACIINFETGDPLEAPPVVFTIVTNGTTYHLQDEVFLPWYLHNSPSYSVNGFYSFLGTFVTPSTLCGPG